jgi:hypothetical protein
MKVKQICTALMLAVVCPAVNAQIIPLKKNNNTQSSITARTFSAAEWLTGAMPDTTGNGTPTTTNLKQLVIANNDLEPLGVTLGGSNLIVCNNPERFTGDGWLFQHSFTDATQGGVDYPLSGTTKIYMFHLNYTSPAATKYISLVVHNPGATAVNYSYKGANYNNVDKPLTGAASGQSYWVSRDWISNTPTTTSGTINANSKLIVFTKVVNSANMFDGLYEVTTSGPVYYYTVVTSTNNATTVRSAASIGSAYASFAAPPDPRVTQSDYRMETGGSYARGAGLFTASDVSSDNTLVIPNVPSRIGFCFNTSSKFFPMLEKQNPTVVVKNPPTTDSVRSIYSSSHNYGNYGMKYNSVFHLQNNTSVSKTVNIYFAENENLVDASLTNGTWNSRFKIDGTASASYDIYIQRNNPRKLLKTVTVPTGTTDFTVEVYIPGLITTNHQLIFETTTTVPGTLPVTLSSFAGKEENGLNKISWKTEQEINLSHYELERLTESNSVGWIKKITATNNPSVQTYHYNDTITSLGKKQYRLKMVNIDGTFTYSPIVIINNQQKELLKVMGNPFTDKLTVQLQTAFNENVQLELYSSEGKLVQRTTATAPGNITLPHLQQLKPGTYTLKAITKNNTITTTVIKL